MRRLRAWGPPHSVTTAVTVRAFALYCYHPVVIKTAQNANLDILRSIAVISVFATHSIQVISGAQFGQRMVWGVDTWALGRIGVLIFFVHTSLVLMQSLARTGTDLSGWRLMRFFYIRRLFRIYPLSICLVLLSVALSIPPHALNAPYVWEGAKWMWSNILLVQNITGVWSLSAPMWSLPFEVQMYLALPIVFLLLPKSGGLIRLTAIYAIGALYSGYDPLLRYVPCFLAGVVAYQLLGMIRARLPGWLWGPVVIGVIALYILGPYSDASPLKDGIACLLVGALIPQFRVNHGIITSAASRIAKYSYGIYLCHTPLLWFSRRLMLPVWQEWIWLLLATGVVSVLCYSAIEHPLIEVGTRLAKWISPARVADAGRSVSAKLADAGGRADPGSAVSGV